MLSVLNVVHSTRKHVGPWAFTALTVKELGAFGTEEKENILWHVASLSSKYSQFFLS